MRDEKSTKKTSIVDRLIDIFVELPWLKIILEVPKVVQALVKRSDQDALYEVLEYKSTLELKDRNGTRANFKKREKVRYLQNNLIAYQDQAWGDGKILVNYGCKPGKPVDQYRSGHKTYILISRREVKNKGDVDQFNINWKIHRGFLKTYGFWETHVTHPTKSLEIHVIFPKNRPPIHTSISEANRRRTRPLGESDKTLLPDGRCQVTWKTENPRLYENYILQWEW